MADREKTYEFVSAAFSVGDECAVTAGMIAATYWGKGPNGGVRVRRVRDRLDACGKKSWVPTLRRILHGMGDNDRLGRFRALHTQWSADKLIPRADWVRALRRLAGAKRIARAVSVATWMERNLKGHGGPTGYLLGQFMHLLHPEWFAVVNGENEAYWRALGYEVGGVANLVAISADYRRGVREYELDFNVIDDTVAVPFVRVLRRRGG